MAAKRDRPPSIDPAVADLLQAGQRRQAERELPVADRRKLLKERQKIAARNRLTIDLPQALVDRVAALAQRQGCPQSQLIHAMMLFALVAIDAGDFALDELPRTPSRSPRYEWNLDLRDATSRK
jgi:hypothetical protein